MSDNFFKNSKLLVDRGNRFLLVKGMIFVARAEKNSKDQDVSLLVAHARTKNLKFEKVNIPVKHLNKNGFTILASDYNSQMLHVNHFGSNSPFGKTLLFELIYIQNNIFYLINKTIFQFFHSIH